MRTGSSLRSHIVSTVLAAVIGLSGAVAVVTPAQAASVTPLCLAAAKMSGQDRNEMINLGVAQMKHAGQSTDQINRQVKERYGLVKVSRDVAPAIEPLSSNSIVNVYAPSVYKDTCSSYWYVFATWSFNSITGLKADYNTFCGIQCAMGGEEGFGVAWNRNVSYASGYSMTTWGRTSWYPASTGRADVADANVYGATFTGIDHFYYPADQNSWDYSWYNGQLVYSTTGPGCGALQAFSKYGHDWSSTTINSFSVAPWSLSINFSSSSNRWLKSSQPSNVVYPC